VARLIVKNSLNDQLRDHLIQTCSVSNSTCCPNTINEAVSLLSTFKKATCNNNTNDNNNSSEDDVVVSCHVSEDNVNDTSPDVINDVDHSDINTDIDTDQPEVNRQVSFNATVMAAVIA
jgi:hypothetical protein